MPPARLSDRFLAFLVDLVPFVCGWCATVLAAARAGADPERPLLWRAPLAVWAALYLAYQAWGNRRGATVGKALFGLRVLGADGEPLGAARAAARALGLLASVPLGSLGCFWSFVDPRSRAWHDLIAGSVVVDERERAPGWASAVLALACGGALLGLGLWGAARAPSASDREAVLRAREGMRVLARIQERHREGTGRYAARLSELAQASGDPVRFKESMAALFDPDRFLLQAGSRRYRVRARALDRRRTELVLEGP